MANLFQFIFLAFCFGLIVGEEYRPTTTQPKYPTTRTTTLPKYPTTPPKYPTTPTTTPTTTQPTYPTTPTTTTTTTPPKYPTTPTTTPTTTTTTPTTTPTTTTTTQTTTTTTTPPKYPTTPYIPKCKGNETLVYGCPPRWLTCMGFPALGTCVLPTYTCRCKEGYAFAKDGSCVLPGDCPCSTNEEYKVCGPCEYNCAGDKLNCPYAGCTDRGRCQCKDGCVRNAANVCINKYSCPKILPIPTPGCAAGWSEFGNHCYKVIVKEKGGYTWDEAKKACETLEDGCKLASIHGEAENIYIAGLLKKLSDKKRGCWIGMRLERDESKEVKGCSWSDGTAVDWANPTKMADKCKGYMATGGDCKLPWLYGEPHKRGEGKCVHCTGLDYTYTPGTWSTLDCNRRETEKGDKMGAICKAPKKAHANKPTDAHATDTKSL